MSANTGLAPVKRMLLTDAMNVNGLVMTSSPGPTPCASRARWRAVVPDDVAMAWRVPVMRANASSNAAVRGPCASMPESRTSSTAAFSSGPIQGRDSGIGRGEAASDTAAIVQAASPGAPNAHAEVMKRSSHACMVCALVVAALAGCSQQASVASSSPKTTSRPSSAPSAGPASTLGVYVQRSDTVAVTVVEVSGLRARVVATARLAPRTGVTQTSCPPGMCGGAVDPPYVSTTRDRIFVLDGDTDVKELSRGGALRHVTSIGGSASVRAAFAVSPDDRRIAVALLNLGPGAVGSEKVFVQDLGGGNRLDLRLPAPLVCWPIGWRQDRIVFAGGALSGGLARNPYG